MKIDVNGAYRAYAKNVIPTPHRAQKRDDKAGAVQQDRVAISSAAYKNDPDRISASTAAEVEAKGTARVSELRQAVAAGSYHVPTEKLADAVLSTLV